MSIELLNCDCMEYMATLPDKAFDLAIVDPPYGIGAADDSRFGIKHNGAAAERKLYERKEWDSEIPKKDFFDLIFRVAEQQIVWGVNYYPDSRLTGGRIFWDKCCPERYSKSAGELAYKSKGYGIDYFRSAWHGMIQENMRFKEHRIHPTQKPVKLYEWLLTRYAKPGQRILDTHLGSGSSAIAAHNLGFDFVGMELDKDYYDAACARLKAHQAQSSLFESEMNLNSLKPVQMEIN